MSLRKHPLVKAAALPIKRAYRIYDVYKYHRNQGNQARTIYANIVSRDPSRALTPAQLSDMDDYAHETYGDIRYAPWLVTYAAVRREFKPGCIPDNYVGIYMLKHLIGEWKPKLGRIHQRRVLDSPLFPEILRCENGRLLRPDDSEIAPDALNKEVFADGEHVFLKLANTGQGRGVRQLSRSDFHADMLPMEQDFVIQRALRQDPDLDRFNVGAASTVRITTVMKNGRAESREAHIRFVQSGFSHVVAGGAVAVSIDCKSGAFFPIGIKSGWTLIDRHPNTGERFLGNTLPHLEAMKTQCEALHEKVPQVGWLGWDICPMANGEFAIMEVNAGHSDIKFGEAFGGPYFADLGWDKLHKQHSIF